MKPQFIYYPQQQFPSRIAEEFEEEAYALAERGLSIGTSPQADSNPLILRSYILWDEQDYPHDPRYLHGWREYEAASKMSIYLPFIRDLTFDTFFVEDLNDDCICEIRRRGWDRAFIKNDVKSLWGRNDVSSVWPDCSMNRIKEVFLINYPKTRLFAIRKYVNPSVFLTEERYWVILDTIYHRNEIIPSIVYETVKRLRPLGIKYYTIDAIPNQIVEINPGESSDRYGVNSPEVFASWWKKALSRFEGSVPSSVSGVGSAI